jgi:hypothetical protein
MSRPNPGPTSLQVRFSNAKTTTESYRFGAEPGFPHRDFIVPPCVEGVDCRTGAAVDDVETVVVVLVDDLGAVELHAPTSISATATVTVRRCSIAEPPRHSGITS